MDGEYSTANCAESKSNVSKWLGKKLRIEMSDGRIVEGEFMCTDSVPNIILSGTKVSLTLIVNMIIISHCLVILALKSK